MTGVPDPTERARARLLAVGALLVIAAVAASAAEIDATKFFGKPLRDMRKTLGNLTHRGECADLEAAQQTEYEHGYVCVQNGVVALLGYDFRSPADSPEAALALVGISAGGVRPEALGSGSYQWAVRTGNPIRIGGKKATRVIVSLQLRTVIVNVGRE